VRKATISLSTTPYSTKYATPTATKAVAALNPAPAVTTAALGLSPEPPAAVALGALEDGSEAVPEGEGEGGLPLASPAGVGVFPPPPALAPQPGGGGGHMHCPEDISPGTLLVGLTAVPVGDFASGLAPPEDTEGAPESGAGGPPPPSPEDTTGVPESGGGGPPGAAEGCGGEGVAGEPEGAGGAPPLAPPPGDLEVGDVASAEGLGGAPSGDGGVPAPAGDEEGGELPGA